MFKNNHMTFLSRLQDHKPLLNLPKPWNSLDLPEPASGTYTTTHGAFQNLPEPAPGTRTSIRRNPPEPSGTCLWHLHQHMRKPCGNYTSTPEPPKPTPTHRNPSEPPGTFLQNLHQHTPKPSTTGSCDPHLHTPELIWAEDPISLHCWGNTKTFHPMTENHALPI